MQRKLVSASQVDYYAILGVRRTATREDIRSSFKRLMLLYHPDKNPQRREWSERRVREINEAFEVLSDGEARAAFDIRLSAHERGGKGPAARWRRVPEQPFFFTKKDPEARALLILHLLVNRKTKAAVDLLSEMEESHGRTFLSRNLSREDYLDCLFLLGEFYLGRRRYPEAVVRLEELLAHESKARFPRHYMDQVVEFLKDIYLRKLPRHGPLDEAITGLRRAASLRLTRSEELLRLRVLAELCLSRGDLSDAKTILDQAEAGFGSAGKFPRIRLDLDRAEVRRPVAGGVSA